MRNLIEELKIYLSSDVEDLTPQVDVLLHKNILYDSIQYNFGNHRFVLGDTTSTLTINAANYIYLISYDPFVVTIDDIDVITQHFTYVNLVDSKSIEVKNYSENDEDIEVKYIYGTV